MKNIYIYCEGPTEESFINEILYPYFLNRNVFARLDFGAVSTFQRMGAVYSILSIK